MARETKTKVAATTTAVCIGSLVALMASNLPVFRPLLVLTAVLAASLYYLLISLDQAKDRPLWMKALGVIGVCAFVAFIMGDVLREQHRRETRPRFTITAGSLSLIRGGDDQYQAPHILRTWAVDQGEGWKSTDLDMVQFFRITNNSDVPLQIAGYFLEVNLDGTWKGVPQIPMYNPNIVEVQFVGDPKPQYIDFGQTHLDRAAQADVMQPGRSIEGWLFFRSESEADRPAVRRSSFVEYRLKIFDTSGAISQAEALPLGATLIARQKEYLFLHDPGWRPPWVQSLPYLGLNLDGYCQRHKKGTARYISLMGWVCASDERLIDMQTACEEEHGEQHVAIMVPPGGMSYWRCKPK